MKNLFTALAALAAIVAAFLWYKASAAEVPYVPDRSADKPAIVLYNDDHRWDLIRTAELQTKWNKRASLAASLAALLQAISLAISG